MAFDASEPPSGPPSSSPERRISVHPAGQPALAFQHAPVGLAMVDGSGLLREANPRFCDLAGLSLRAMRGRRVVDLLPVAEALAAAGAEEGEPAWHALELDEPTGEPRELLIAVQAVDAGNTRLLTLVAVDEFMAAMSGQDALTGLASAWLFQDRLIHAMERADRLDQGLALLLIELDGHTALAGEIGPAVARELECQVARRIERTFRSEDSVARLGPGRWGVVIEHPVSPLSLQTAAQRFQEAMDAPFDAAGQPLLLTTSIGIARYPEDGEGDEELMERAGEALSRAGMAGPGRHDFFDAGLRRRLEERVTFQRQLLEALLSPGKHFHIVYQPQVNPADGRCQGLEALVRWRHPRRGLLHPRDFLPEAAELGQLIRLDRWVLERVILQHRQWREEGSMLATLGVSVNLDTAMLEQSVFDSRPLDHFLRQQAENLAWLSLEIDGAGLAAMGEAHAHLLKRLGQLGITLVADELGCKPLDLLQLAGLPVSRAKVSRRLVSGIGRRASADRTLAALGPCLAALGMRTVVVGIETDAQLEAAREQGFALLQGNLFAPPLEVAELKTWYATQ
ncbi:EAL domain-containing protein [Halomonas sp. C05BenzN]|uniref:EAL domain-containing protein n=1 Tax=Halomonas sp. C05BenzN TaxID=3411041 RepID=UPI003B927BDD